MEGQLYELDGRKPGPLALGPSSADSFLTDAAAACQAYMASDPENINFTVLALTAAAWQWQQAELKMFDAKDVRKFALWFLRWMKWGCIYLYKVLSPNSCEAMRLAVSDLKIKFVLL